MFPYLPLQRRPSSDVPLTCVPDPYYDTPTTGDQYFSSVLLLLHGDGANGSTTFTDSSSYGRTMAISGGSPAISTAQKVFGTGSILGAGSVQITTAKTGSEWNSDHWTWECRYRRTSDSGYHAFAFFKDNLYIILDDVVGGSDTWRLQIVLNGSVLASSVSASTLNTWDAWAVTVSKSGSTYTYRIFFNGVLETTGTSTDVNFSLTSGAAAFNIGKHDSGGFAGLTGYLDEYRLTAACRYTASYDLELAAFPNVGRTDPHTILSLHGESLVDSSSEPKTLTLGGTASFASGQGVFSSSALSVVSTGSVTANGLTVASNPDFQFGSGDWTLECWVKRTSHTNVGCVLYALTGLFAVYAWEVDGRMRWTLTTSLGSFSDRILSFYFTLNAYVHLVVQRRGANMEVYGNGALIDTVAVPGGAGATINWTTQLNVGRNGATGAQNWTGYIDDLRITKGVARYTAAFTPPVLTFCDSVAGDGGDTTPVAAPAPAPSPVPPVTPVVFDVAAVSPVDFTKSTAISPARTLATVTTAETGVSIVASATVPGVTFNVVGSPVTSITATGTPTTAAQTRVVLTYVRNDGSGTVLGSSTHDVRVIDPAVLFTVGPCANLSARVGEYVDVVLCEPTMAANVSSVIARANYSLPASLHASPFTGTPSQEMLAWQWTPGVTSAGTYRATGAPTIGALGTYTLTVSYYSNTGWPQLLLGTSTHSINITSASTPASPAPAPSPAPTPPTPAPAPSPPAAPAPNPIPGSDPYFASVLVLHHFDAADTVTELQDHTGEGAVTDSGSVVTITRDVSANRAENGERIADVYEIRPRAYRGTGYTADMFTRVLNVCTINAGATGDLIGTATVLMQIREPLRFIGEVGPALSGSMIAAPGASGLAAGFDGGGLTASISSAFDATSADITAECVVKVDSLTGLWAAGSGMRFTPILTCVNPGGEFVWCMGLLGTSGALGREVQPFLWRATRNGSTNPTIAVSGTAGAVLTAAPGRFVHFAAQFGPAGERNACWWEGIGGSTTQTLTGPADGVPLRTGAVLLLGGSAPRPPNAGIGGATITPLVGAIDELRITADFRYSYADATTTAAISAALRNLPWPDY